MKNIEHKFLKFVRAEKLITPEDKVLVAFSGGADSLSLLLLLINLSKILKIKIGAAHINHLLRNEESERDEEFCEDFSMSRGIDYYSKRIDVKHHHDKNNKTLEETARELRYQELNEIAEKNGYNKIATAHNMNDNAETVIYNLIKGTGLSGLSGIPIKRDKIIRPLLNISRDEIENYLQINGIEFRQDSSNLDTNFSRNFLRHEIFPKLKQINPSFETALFNNSQIVKRMKDHIEAEVFELQKQYVEFTESSIKISKNLFTHENEYLNSEVIKSSLQKLELSEVSISDVSKILELNTKQVGTKEELKSDFYAFKDRDQIIIHKKKWNEINIKIVVGDEIQIGNKVFGIEQIDLKSKSKNVDSNEEFISSDNLDDIFILRSWKNGDYFYPLGMRGKKKVSDFLTDVKLPSAQKKESLVLTNRNNIVWVVGLRLDERYKISEKTKSACRLWIK